MDVLKVRQRFWVLHDEPVVNRSFGDPAEMEPVLVARTRGAHRRTFRTSTP